MQNFEEFVQSYDRKPGDNCWCYDCPGMYDVLGKPREDCQVCDGSGKIPGKWFLEQFKKQREKETQLGIEDIKALESGKVYAVAVDFTKPNACEYCEGILKAFQQFGISIILFARGTMEFISAPEGIEIVKKEG